MKQVIVVDDEAIIRQWFSMIIQKSDLEFQIVGTASNGQIALDLCKERNVDIVITDIKMPQMDGLTFIQELRKFSTHIKIIILSNYEDFSFAKEALKYGASDYLLKAEIEEADLLAALKKATQDIDAMENEKQQISQLLQELDQEKHIIRMFFLRNWLSGAVNDTSLIKEKLSSFQIDLDERNLFALLFRMDHYDKEQGEKSEGERKQLAYTVMSEIDKVRALDVGNGYLVEYEENSYVMLINVKVNSLKNTREMLYWLGMKMIHEVKNSHNISMSVGISSDGIGLETVTSLYSQASDSLEERFFGSECCIFFYMDTLLHKAPDRRSLEWLRLQGTAEHIREQLDKWDVQEALKGTEALWHGIDRHSGITPKELQRMAARVAQLFMGKARRLGLDLTDKTSDEWLLMEAERCDFFHTLREWLWCIVSPMAERIHNGKNKGSTIHQALSYMGAYYTNELTLTEVARHIHLSPAYFSTYFKEQTGENFNQYLMKLRIGKAKELLMTTDVKISELAEAVGYPNASYFIRVFKKMEGISPNEYKNMPWNK